MFSDSKNESEYDNCDEFVSEEEEEGNKCGLRMHTVWSCIMPGMLPYLPPKSKTLFGKSTYTYLEWIYLLFTMIFKFTLLSSVSMDLKQVNDFVSKPKCLLL